MISVTIDSPNPGIGPQWDDLVRRANSNVFMNPAALTAAAELNFARIQVLLAWEEGGGERKLVGVWALQARRPVPFWPVLLEALPYNYAFLSSPVVDSACVDEVIAAFFVAIEKSPSLPKVLSLPSLDAECPSYPAISRELARRGIEPLMLSEDARPFVTREFGVKRSPDAQEAAAGGKRLSAPGTADVVNDRTPDGARQAFESFRARPAERRPGHRAVVHPNDAAFSSGVFRTWRRRATLRSRCCGSMASRFPRRC
jgi:hypothetical protein